MLGEIRDEESALMALRAAQTGHLVLSTLHTNDAISAISRLQQLGIQSHEIENSLLLVIAQRLVRKRCLKCGQHFSDSCDCHQGYQGRIGVYQFLQCENNRYQTDFESLYQSALEKVKERITDLAEIQRVLIPGLSGIQNSSFRLSIPWIHRLVRILNIFSSFTYFSIVQRHGQ